MSLEEEYHQAIAHNIVQELLFRQKKQQEVEAKAKRTTSSASNTSINYKDKVSGANGMLQLFVLRLCESTLCGVSKGISFVLHNKMNVRTFALHSYDVVKELEAARLRVN